SGVGVARHRSWLHRLPTTSLPPLPGPRRTNATGTHPSPARGEGTNLSAKADSLRGPAAVEHERGAGHQRGSVGGEKHNRAGDLVELAEATELDLRQHLVAERFVLKERPRHRCLQESRTETID